MKNNEIDYKRLILTLVLCTGLLVVWQYTVELPRRQEMTRIAMAKAKAAKAREVAVQKQEVAAMSVSQLPRAERLAQSPRVKVISGKLHGSIRLKGLRFDDLKLAQYRTELDRNSPEVQLLTLQTDELPYFAHIGWLSADQSVAVPGKDTLWQADGETLTPEVPVKLSWDNGQGVRFIVEISLDAHYLFSISQSVENHSGREIVLQPFAYINRAYQDPHMQNYILHEGGLGGLNSKLDEISYADLREEGPKKFEDVSGWLGFTDKYWQTALIPQQDGLFTANFSHYKSRGRDRYQTDYIGPELAVPNGTAENYVVRFFAGAKEIDVLNQYTAGDPSIGLAPVPLFDRAVDFGSLYFLTKPLFLLLNFFFKLVGNFGVAIMLLTIVVKFCMFPLANKAYISTSHMRALQPEMEKLKEKFGDDRVKFNQEIMALYKREKVNPAAGCFPVLIQMPVFFALYKVLFVTIEMRHAPFFAWIHDLSVADPSNIFTLFGVLQWNPPSAMHLGVLPILMCLSMVIQMRQQPKPTDPVQAKVIKFMPYVLLLVFAKMPAGLVLYWTWSNILSILQQQYITSRFKRRQAKQAAA